MTAPDDQNPPASDASSVTAVIRVLIVDDHPVVRTGLSTLLSLHPEVQVVETAADAESGLAILRAQSIDVLVLDLRMPKIPGVEMLKRMKREGLSAPTLVLSSFELDEEIKEALAAGARGYLLKDTAGDDILAAIRSVHAGRSVLPARILKRLGSRRVTSNLSDREREVLALLARGLTNKEIAAALQISSFTVRNHVSNITSKLDASDRTEAAYIALQTGILTLASD